MKRRRIRMELASAEVSAMARHNQKILNRRSKSVKILFVVYIWYSVCLLPALLDSALFPDCLLFYADASAGTPCFTSACICHDAGMLCGLAVL